MDLQILTFQLHAPKESCPVPFSNIAMDLYANIFRDITTSMFEAFFETEEESLLQTFEMLNCSNKSAKTPRLAEDYIPNKEFTDKTALVS